jgi:hypothetical protein
LFAQQSESGLGFTQPTALPHLIRSRLSGSSSDLSGQRAAMGMQLATGALTSAADFPILAVLPA